MFPARMVLLLGAGAEAGIGGPAGGTAALGSRPELLGQGSWLRRQVVFAAAGGSTARPGRTNARRR